ncbi:MAG: hypothetical protein ACI8R1_002362, partial [Psychrobacter glaciei]
MLIKAMPIKAMPIKAMPIKAMPIKAMPIKAMPIELHGLIGIFCVRRCIDIRACPHFKNEDKSEVNGSQTRKIAQIISIYYLA